MNVVFFHWFVESEHLAPYSGAPPLSGLEQDRCDSEKLDHPLLHVAKMEGEENMVAVELESNMTYFWRVDSTREGEGFLNTGDTWTSSTK